MRKGTGALQDENSRVTAGGATKMETSEKKDEVVEKVEDKRSMEV